MHPLTTSCRSSGVRRAPRMHATSAPRMHVPMLCTPSSPACCPLVHLGPLLARACAACRYLQDKDLFERYYKQHLSKRLLIGRVTNDDAEHAMLSKLKTECGYQFTSKLESMFMDIKTSQETMQAFRAHLAEQRLDLQVDISVQVSGCMQAAGQSAHRRRQDAGPALRTCMRPKRLRRGRLRSLPSARRCVQVLTTGSWPSAPGPMCSLPSELQPSTAAFEDYYAQKHSGRQLKWHPSMGTADLKATIRGKRVMLTVTTYQMVVLMLLNDHPTITFADLLSVRCAAAPPPAAALLHSGLCCTGGSAVLLPVLCSAAHVTRQSPRISSCHACCEAWELWRER
jgi:cullin 3